MRFSRIQKHHGAEIPTTVLHAPHIEAKSLTPQRSVTVMRFLPTLLFGALDHRVARVAPETKHLALQESVMVMR